MDVCIPFSGISNWQQNDLRFALRSIEKNYPDHREIFIIGQKPDWIKNITHIPFRDEPTRPGRNIFGKMLLCPREKFISWFDDHYLLKPVSDFPPYYNGEIPEIKLKKNGRYLLNLQATEKKLKELSVSLRCYDSHIPCIFEKQNLQQLTSFDWNKDYALKSLYFNIFGPVGFFHLSVKTQLPYTKEEFRAKDLTWLSSPDTIPKGLSAYLHELFPDKCKFEK